MVDTEMVKKAIAPLEAGFDADGVKVEVGAIKENSVVIRLLVSSTTCRECMMPIPHLETLFEQSLQDEGISGLQVCVVIDEASSAAS